VHRQHPQADWIDTPRALKFQTAAHQARATTPSPALQQSARSHVALQIISRTDFSPSTVASSSTGRSGGGNAQRCPCSSSAAITIAPVRESSSTTFNTRADSTHSFGSHGSCGIGTSMQHPQSCGVPGRIGSGRGVLSQQSQHALPSSPPQHTALASSPPARSEKHIPAPAGASHIGPTSSRMRSVRNLSGFRRTVPYSIGAPARGFGWSENLSSPLLHRHPRTGPDDSPGSG